MNFNENYDEINTQSGVIPKVVYTGTLSSAQLWSYIKIIGFYALELIAWVIIARMYAAFGTKLMTPMISTMWVMGAVTAMFIKEDRDSTVKQTKWMIAGYLGLLFVYRFAIKLVSVISSDQMGVALDMPVPAASGAAAAGFLQNLLWIIGVMYPAAFIFMCGKKFFLFRGKRTKEEAFRKAKGIRDNIKRF